MTIIRNGSADRAPEYFNNATGHASWSGKHVDELTAKHAIEILVFCEDEARRQGWNAELRDEKSDRNEFLFHPEFLDGHPHGWWNFYHQIGREEYRSRNEEDSSVDDGGHEQAWSISARLAALAIADGAALPPTLCALVHEARELHPEMAPADRDSKPR